MGKLQRHTIQQRAKLNKIQELDHSSSTSADRMKPLKSKTLITPMKEAPELVLVKTGLESEDSLKLRATIALPKILNKHQISDSFDPVDLSLVKSEVQVMLSG